MQRLGCFGRLTTRLSCFASSTGVASLQALDPLLSSQPTTDGAQWWLRTKGSDGSYGVCRGVSDSKLHYVSAASPHVSKIRLASSQAPLASRLFKASCMWLGSGPPSHSILFVNCHSCLSN